MNINSLKSFSMPYYEKKDMMHNLWHIELVYKSVCYIVRAGNYKVDSDLLTAATYFHGFIKTHEVDIRAWLASSGFCNEEIEKVIQITLESHVASIPESLEGKILHDAHLIEGGKVYMITKCLITGSLRGQSLLETIAFVEENILGKRTCYLPETTPLFEEAHQFACQYIADLKNGLRR